MMRISYYSDGGVCVYADIVFVRTWFPVSVTQLYNPVTTLLLPREEKNKWRGMKTAGQLRRERGLQRQADTDSLYRVSCASLLWLP